MTTTPIRLTQPVTVPVAGVSFHQNIVRSLNENERVIIQRDRENEFDANAIAFYTLEGEHFGYMPRKVAEKFADSPEERWGGVVAQVLPGETWGLRVQITHTNIPQFPVKPKRLSYTDAPVAAEPANMPPEGDPGQVFSRSGRLLGVAVNFDPSSNAVTARDDAGVVKTFPAGAVTVIQSPKVAHAPA